METFAGVLNRLCGNINWYLGQAVRKLWQVSWAGCMETLAVVLGRLFGNIGRCLGQSVSNHETDFSLCLTGSPWRVSIPVAEFLVPD